MNRPSFPLYASVNINTTCNLNCIYCYMKPHKNKLMPVEDFKIVVDQLAAGQIFYILISGGEPFLHPCINEIITYACENVNEVSIVTNGTMISQKHLRFLKDSGISNLHMQVSLDSIIEEENVYLRNFRPEVIFRVLEELVKIGIKPAVGMVITKYNIKSIHQSMSYLQEYANHFNIMVLQNTVSDRNLQDKLGVTEEDVDAMYKRIDALRTEYGFSVTLPKDLIGNRNCTACGSPCAAGFTYLAIDPDLKVRPCDRVTNVFVGNLRKNTIAQIWDSPELATINASEIPICSEFK